VCARARERVEGRGPAPPRQAGAGGRAGAGWEGGGSTVGAAVAHESGEVDHLLAQLVVAHRRPADGPGRAGQPCAGARRVPARAVCGACRARAGGAGGRARAALEDGEEAAAALEAHGGGIELAGGARLRTRGSLTLQAQSRWGLLRCARQRAWGRPRIPSAARGARCVASVGSKCQDECGGARSLPRGAGPYPREAAPGGRRQWTQGTPG